MSCARWIQAAAGGDSATVRVCVPDNSGRLHVIASEGHHDGSGRLRSSRRRWVFGTGREVRVPIKGSPDLTLGIFPLASDGDALGVVEILAPTPEIAGREEVLLALIEESALVLSSAGMRAETERALAGMRAMQRLASELFGAKTPVDAVRVTVDACSECLGVPVAGVLPDRDGWGWFLAASAGLGKRRRSELRAALQAQHDDGAKRIPVPSLRRRFREISCREAVAVRAGNAVLLVGVTPEQPAEFLEPVRSLLTAVLSKLRNGRLGPASDRANDLGIAWTAHELKAPLVGARAALERANQTDVGAEGREWLRRTGEELRQLADLIDPLLRWSTGIESLRRQRADLVSVVRGAVASASLEWDAERVVVDTPDHLLVRADERQLRIAVANVVRNALSYSPRETPVKVRVEHRDHTARVVIRDRGPGIPATERVSVFDPFTRGRAGSVRGGFGLGLFIARRVLEAHGGSISLRPNKSGATFVLELPIPNGRRPPSAS